jgi:hypothetical protein
MENLTDGREIEKHDKEFNESCTEKEIENVAG